MDVVRSKPGFKKFERGSRRQVTLPGGQLVKTAPWRSGASLPLVVEPELEDLDLAEWAQNHRHWIDERLQRHGAVLFRGFRVRSPDRFERFSRAVLTEIFEDNGEHPRDVLEGGIYTPVFYPPDQQLLWHNENSFNFAWPQRILFCCVRPADQGGETPVVDSRRMYETLAPEIRERFERHGVMYVRNFGEGLGRTWQQVFQTSDPSEVEEICRRERVELEWLPEDGLRTRSIRPATVRHHRTGEVTWFNQAQHWHPACLDAETGQSMASLFAPEEMPRNCLYGDGEPILDATMEAILGTYQQQEQSVPWQRGDVMLVDNVLAAHGRNPFAGERKLLVAMGDMATYPENEEERRS